MAEHDVGEMDLIFSVDLVVLHDALIASVVLRKRDAGPPRRIARSCHRASSDTAVICCEALDWPRWAFSCPAPRDRTARAVPAAAACSARCCS